MKRGKMKTFSPSFYMMLLEIRYCLGIAVVLK